MGNPSVASKSGSPPAFQTGNILFRSLLAIVGVALVGGTFLYLTSTRKPAKISGPHELEKTVAVLPFKTVSGNAADDYFAEGIAADLISGLTRLRDLKTIGLSSSFQFKGKNDDSKAIGAKLGATCLLEANVERGGSQLKIAAKLLDAADGNTIWSQSYERDTKDVFAVESEILHVVAEKLRVAIPSGTSLTPWRPSNGDLRAYDAMLRGDFDARTQTEDGYHKAIAHYDEAIKLDPNYAATYAARGFTWENLGAEHLGGDALKDAFANAERDANKALELDSKLATAHIALGLIDLDAKSDFSAAEAAFRRASELEPSDAIAASSLATLIGSTGRLSEAVDLSHRALTLDPLRARMYNFLSQILVPLRRYEEAEQAIRKAMELQPNLDIFYTEFAIIEFFRGNGDAALQTAQKETDGFWRVYTLALLHALRGDQPDADAALKDLIDKYADIGPFQIADIYAARKDPDAAFKWLDRAYEGHDAGITQLLYSPFLLAYRNDPRFAAFCKKAGLPLP